ncbi:MAG: ribosome silencing factor [Bacillota bacterium]|nr:ribosome silencing factor [Bacillota bacterium]
MNSKEMVDKIVEILDGKKAKDINVINIENISILSDYFVICNGTSSTHIKTLADEVETKLEELGVRYYRKEGYNSARWILLDYSDVIIHIFHEEDRSFYNLERLWSDGVMSYR